MTIAGVYVSLVACVVVFCVCVARLDLTSAATDRQVRWSLSALATTALAFGLAPFVWTDGHAVARAAFSVSVAWHLFSLAPSWRSAPPRELHREGERRTGGDRRKRAA